MPQLEKPNNIKPTINIVEKRPVQPIKTNKQEENKMEKENKPIEDKIDKDLKDLENLEDLEYRMFFGDENKPNTDIKPPEPQIVTEGYNPDEIKKEPVSVKTDVFEDEILDAAGIFKKKKTIFYIFITPPLIISIISMLHLITFYNTGNPLWMAYLLAGSIEVASIASLLALALLKKITKSSLYLLFGSLLIIQTIGNMYFSFIYLQTSDMLQQTLDFFSLENTMGSVRLLSFLIGAVPVIISLGFIKSAINYLK